MELLQITKSRLRMDMLNLYFTNPEKKFYLRELERILNFPVANIRRELLKLEKIGLFESEKKGNLVYYSLRRSYPLFPELKSIIHKTAGIPGILRKALSKLKGVEIAFIYGSFAKGEENTTSDIDLFIIGKVDELQLIRLLKPIEKKIQREINYTIYTRKDYESKRTAKDPFLMDVTKGQKAFLIGDENEL